MALVALSVVGQRLEAVWAVDMPSGAAFGRDFRRRL